MNVLREKYRDDVEACYRLAQDKDFSVEQRCGWLISAGVLIEGYVDKIEPHQDTVHVKDHYRMINNEKEYHLLLNSGMFWDIYPELSGIWTDDLKLITQ